MDQNMSKALANDSQKNLLVKNCLSTIETTNKALKQITKILLLLTDKRATVAERAIKSDLFICANLEAHLISHITQLLVDESPLFADYKKLKEINKKLSKQLQAFLKAASYDLNYLEQYFEHDFWLEFKDSKYIEQLNTLAENINTNSH